MIKSFLKSLAYGFLIILFPIMSGVIIQVKAIDDTFQRVLIQALMFFLASLVGFLIYGKKEKITGNSQNNKILLYFIPLIIVEALNISQGLRDDLTIKLFLIYLIFTIFIAIAEELFFRGLILSELYKHGETFAIISSSILFGVFHIANILGGSSLQYTVLQILFAILFGLVSALLVVIRGSLAPAILWHFSHNFLTYISSGSANIGTSLTNTQLIISSFQYLILIFYAIHLFKSLKNNIKRPS